MDIGGGAYFVDDDEAVWCRVSGPSKNYWSKLGTNPVVSAHRVHQACLGDKVGLNIPRFRRVDQACPGDNVTVLWWS